MSASVAATQRVSRSSRRRLDAHGIALWTAAFAGVVLLSLAGGGYDAVLRGQVGLVLWWVVAVGAAVGVLPTARLSRAGWSAVGLLAALALWTALSGGWSESQERTVADAGKVAAYLGAFVCALTAAGRTPARHAVNAIAAATAAVAGVALATRLQPQLASEEIGAFFGEAAQRRLAEPLNYWNALAAFMAMALPLVLRSAVAARTLTMQALATAAVPLLGLTLFLTVSRGGIGCAAVALAVWLALTPNRLGALPVVLVAAAGTALLVAAADQRDALQSGLDTAAAREEGDALTAIAIVVCFGVASLRVALGLVARHVARPAWTAVPRRTTAAATAVAALAAVAVAVAAGLPGEAGDRWEQFKTASVAPAANAGEDPFDRLSGGFGGNSRYAYWRATADMQNVRPLGGTGSGTFELWWSRNRTSRAGGFNRDAHSLYMETFGELGIVGVALVGGFLLLALGVGARRSFGRQPREHRTVMAAATAGIATFAAAAAIEWVWEMTVVAVTMLVLAAVVLGGGRLHRRPTGGMRVVARIALAGLAVLGIAATAIPLAGASSVRDSRAAARAGDAEAALAAARTARRLQPYAATAHMQEALVLADAGALAQALEPARRATAHEPTNWRTWIVRSTIEARLGRAEDAVRSYRRARRLNPTSEIFTG